MGEVRRVITTNVSTFLYRNEGRFCQEEKPIMYKTGKELTRADVLIFTAHVSVQLYEIVEKYYFRKGQY